MTREQALEELKEGLRALLAQLDGPESAPEVLLRAVAVCDAHVEELLRHEAPSEEEPEARAAFNSSVEEALRLNSVARSVVESQGAQLMAQLEKARGLRKGLSGTSSRSGDAGRSVDVAG